MRRFNEYGLLIFDCDGVILDSNILKIEAMKNALTDSRITTAEVDSCTSFFKNNFGKSRFYHIDHFVNKVINIDASAVDEYKETLLTAYSKQCKRLYLQA
jgi:beta-phosphoglucomutase-like phosphatase (HAD superfamily)